MIPRFEPQLGWPEFFGVLTPADPQAVNHFETAFAETMGQKHAIAFPHGRTGLMLLLEALGLKGREVICPAYTCVVVPHAIVYSGNEPIFVDSQACDFNMDLRQVKEAITDKTGAIITTSIFGYPVNLEQLDEIRMAHPHLAIIQDCAHSFGAEWQGQAVQRAGDAAIFGMNVSKIITSIFGGVVTTDHDELAKKMQTCREQRTRASGWNKAWRRRLYLLAIYVAFNHQCYGFVNYLDRLGLLGKLTKYYNDAVIDMPLDYLTQMTPVEAKIGCLQLARYLQIVEHRRDLAVYYHRALSDLAVHLPPLIDGATYSHFVIQHEKREQIIHYGARHGVQFGRLIEYCIPDMAAYRSRPGARFAYPVARRMAQRALNLSVSTTQRGAVRAVDTFRRAIASGVA